MIIRVVQNSKKESYEVLVERGLIHEAGGVIADQLIGQKVFIISNRLVKKLWYNKFDKSLRKAGISSHLILIGDGERYKDFRTYNHIISQLLSYKADRHSTLIAFGGGVIGDLTGFVAATYMRGINLIHIPTTLIAQIDSGIGGKTAIDSDRAKNMIGAFYNPSMVLIDPDMLRTLSGRDYLNGLFEAIKIAMVSNKNLYGFISSNMPKIKRRNKNTLEKLVLRCAREKIKIIQKDPLDKGLRMILNFGHTFGHALETSGNYKTMTHGKAVGWGMLLALRLSVLSGLNSQDNFDRPEKIIRNLLGGRRPGNLNVDKLWNTIRHDKKAEDNQIRFVLLKNIGYPIIKNIDKRLFVKALEKM